VFPNPNPPAVLVGGAVVAPPNNGLLCPNSPPLAWVVVCPNSPVLAVEVLVPKPKTKV